MRDSGPAPTDDVDPLNEAPSETAVFSVPLHEEELHVSLREVVSGRVRVRTTVETTEHVVRQELDTQQVSVSRVAVGRYVNAAPVVRTVGDLTIIPVLEEVLVVETRLLLKEEIHVRRISSKDTVEHPVVLRRQEALIEHVDGDGADRR